MHPRAYVLGWFVVGEGLPDPRGQPRNGPLQIEGQRWEEEGPFKHEPNQRPVNDVSRVHWRLPTDCGNRCKYPVVQGLIVNGQRHLNTVKIGQPKIPDGRAVAAYVILVLPIPLILSLSRDQLLYLCCAIDAAVCTAGRAWTSAINPYGQKDSSHQKDGAQPNGRHACLDQMLSVPSCWDTCQNNDFCHLCGDGGQMYMCDRCPRSACQKSITLSPEDHVLVTAPGVRYLCISCHLMDDKTEGTGFYLNGKPALARFPKVHGCPELSTKSFIHSTPTIIVHLRLKSIPLAGPMNMLSDFLEQYFPSGDGLTMIDLEFELGTAVKRKAYLQVASKTALQVQEANAHNVLFSISNHTIKIPVICSSESCIAGIVLPQLRRLKVGKPCATWCAGKLRVLCCSCILMPHASSPLVTWPFLVHLTEAIFIEGHTIDNAVPHALAQSTRLRQHSGVYIMTLAPAASSNLHILNTTKYIWSHHDYRPWGNPSHFSALSAVPLSNGSGLSMMKALISTDVITH
ncbi:hypothetical protein BU15DRAFT_65562 [Melanogaster broomeanus]|nr:hypothetical protein BU15DRAFT_65562 [Melanogaster broomeanus]